MANVKISALPSYTGSAADLRWFVMNNSGETTTFKFSGYTSQLIPGTGSNSFETIGSTAATLNSIVIGKNSYVATGDNQIFIGNNIQSSSTGTREKNVVIGSIAGATKPENSNNLIGYDNTPGGAYGNNIVGVNNTSAGHSSMMGSNNTAGFIGTTIGLNNLAGQQSVAIGHSNIAGGGISISIGQNNTDGSNNRIAMIGGSNNIGSAWSVALGYNNTLVGFNNSTESILIGYGNTINGSSAESGNINIGKSQTMNNGSFMTLFGGAGNNIDNSSYSQILNGLNNTINCETSSSERFNTIINGSGNTIFDASDDQTLQTIIGSIDTTFQNGTQRITGIGLSGRTINDAGVGTTYVENLKAFRQIASGFYNDGSVSSAGYTINVNEGDKHEVTITANTNTVLYFTGNLSGGRLVLKVINTSTGGIQFANNSPYVWRLPSTMNGQTANGTDIYIFESFDNQNLWLVSHTQNLS